MKFKTTGIALTAALLLPAAVFAQGKYPVKPLRLILPFAAKLSPAQDRGSS